MHPPPTPLPTPRVGRRRRYPGAGLAPYCTPDPRYALGATVWAGSYPGRVRRILTHLEHTPAPHPLQPTPARAFLPLRSAVYCVELDAGVSPARAARALGLEPPKAHHPWLLLFADELAPRQVW
jgi:hypothetical protein